MRFIHFSDIHIENSSDQSKVLKAFFLDLEKIISESPVNAIILTGDIASKGNTSQESLRTIKANFAQQLKLASKAIPIIVCPGNHDINLKNRKDIYEAIFSSIHDPKSASKFIENSLDSETSGVLAHISGYIEIARELDATAYNKSQLYYTRIIESTAGRIGFASLNSTWLTTGGGMKDYGRLFLGERQIDYALAEIKDCAVKIALLHHSSEWLAPTEKGLIQRALSTNFHAIFCGHNHETTAFSLASNIGSSFISNTGCIYESREYFNGYSIVDFDEEEQSWEVNAREYYYQRDVFDVAPRFAENGSHKFLPPKTRGLSITVISSNVINTVQEKANSKLLSYSASDIAPKQVGAIFVEPPLAEISENQNLANNNGSNKESVHLSIKEIGKSDSSIHILGKRESGKTLLLHEIAANRFRDLKENSRIGFVVDFSILPRITDAAVLESACEFFGNELRKREIIELLEKGEVVACFDNIQPHNQEHVKLLERFQAKYGSSKFIVASSEELISDLTLEEHNIGLTKVKRIYIHSFRKTHTRQLVTKWFGSSDTDSEKRLHLISQLLEKLNVPKTPFLISVLLWVIEQRPNATLINQASAIEVLIEGLLEKFKESKARTDFDSTIQQHFLEDLSVHLDNQNVEWLTSLDFDAFVITYFQKKGLQVSTRGFAEELVRKGLIYEYADNVTFKFDCFRAYFLAKRFAHDNLLWKKALTPNLVQRYVTELDLFTGLNRNKQEVLIAARDLCTDLYNQAKFEIPLDQFDNQGKIHLPVSSAKLTSLEDIVLGNSKNSEKHDEIFAEVEIPSDVSINHDEGRKRKEVNTSSDQSRFIESLRVFSIILRNSELVDDVELKRQCFSLAIDYWAKAMIQGLDAILKEESFKIDSEHLPSILKDFDSEKIRYFMLLMIPTVLTTILVESLATPKLQMFIVESAKEKITVRKMFAIFLALEIRHENALSMTKEFLKNNKTHSVAVQSVFFKLLNFYMLKSHGLSNTTLRSVLADAFSAMRGSDLKEEAIIKAQFLQGLDRQNLKEDKS